MRKTSWFNSTFSSFVFLNMVKHQTWGKIRIMNFELRSTGIRVWLSTTQGLPVCVRDQQTAQNVRVDRHLQSVCCQYAIYLSLCRPHIVQIYYTGTICGSKGTVMVHLIGKPPRTGPSVLCGQWRGSRVLSSRVSWVSKIHQRIRSASAKI